MRTKEELLAKYKATQIKKHGSEEAWRLHKEKERGSIMKALSNYREPSQRYKNNYQSKIGKAYNE